MRNEKALLVLLAYVIGFTTAFIAFGLKQESIPKSTVEYRHEPSDPNPTINDLEVIFTDEGMFAKVEDETMVISGKLSDGIPIGPGFHTSIPRYSTSPSGKYIYYCEQQSEQENACHHLLYLVGKHLSKPLKVQGSSLVTSVTDAQFVWASSDILTSEEYLSTSPSEPWSLQERN